MKNGLRVFFHCSFLTKLKSIKPLFIYVEMQFHQATSVHLKTTPTTEFNPQEVTNLVPLPERPKHVPASMWQFQDPTDSTNMYVAVFQDLNLSDRNTEGDFEMSMRGNLVRASTDPNKLDATNMHGKGKEARLIIFGKDGMCCGLTAFVCESK